MYKQDLALNNLQTLICHKTKPNRPYQLRCFFVFQFKKFSDRISNLKIDVIHQIKRPEDNDEVSFEFL